MKYIRGWIGLFLFLIGIVMHFHDKTKGSSSIVTGLGMGMMLSGFNN